MWPVLAALPIASTTASAIAASTAISSFDLGDVLHGVFGAAIDLGLALLPPEAAHLAHRQALHADAREGLAHGLELVRLNHCNDVFHDTRPYHPSVAAFAVES